jgi:glycosyltransferase involved in cell wall biosynthesis
MQTLSPDYSTTRLITPEPPIIEKKQEDDAFATVLFLPKGQGRQGEGGLRTQGYFKRSLPDKPLITVITVVYNGVAHLEETILSVIGQTYDNVEYIIIDGGSTDGTLDIIRRYEHAIDYWVSEKDGGIYDAMNKGIDLTTGDWINFMNGGDRFYTEQVLQEVFSEKTYTNISIIYGNHEVRYPHKTRIAKAGDIKNIWKGSQFSHQSSFIEGKQHKKNKFNTNNNIAADFEFFYTLDEKNRVFLKINEVVSSITSGGISDTKRIDVIKAWKSIAKNSLTHNTYYNIKIILHKINNMRKKCF